MNRAAVGRAVVRIYLHAREFPPSLETSLVGSALKAGRSMDFAARIRRQADRLDSDQFFTFGRLVGLDRSDMLLWVLPTLGSAEIINYSTSGGQIVGLEEFIEVGSTFLEQVADVWGEHHPTQEELCALESVDLAAHAPMTQSGHQQILSEMGYGEELQQRAINALEGLGLFRRSKSETLNEDIIYNEYVWGTSAVKIAEFLQTLPPNERDVLTQLSAIAIERPGSTVKDLQGREAELLDAARQVGFIDPVGVVTTNRRQSFIFSPTLEQELAAHGSTDSLHFRKLFVAHILFGHRFGFPGTGRINDPLVLVRALLNRGRVGPATAITTDYPMVEAHGIVRVAPDPFHSDRAYLELTNEDVVRDALPILEAALGSRESLGGGDQPMQALWVPGTYHGPESVRLRLRAATGPSKEIFDSAISDLRRRTARRIRKEDLFT
jgi:hypothetical protein